MYLSGFFSSFLMKPVNKWIGRHVSTRAGGDRPGTAWQAGEEGGGPERACARAGGTGPGARAAARWARLEQATTGSPHRAEATKA